MQTTQTRYTMAHMTVFNHRKQVAFTFHLPAELLSQLERRAAEDNRSADELAMEVVAAFLEEREWANAVERARQSTAAGKGWPFEEVAAELQAKAARIAGE